MIEFKRLSYKNFLSVGNRPVTIDFSGKDICIVTGSNGNGKSALILALYYALYGKSFRKINLPNMINCINKKNLLVELEFSVNGNNYKIKRGMKPNIFEIYINGKLKEQDAAIKDYQDFLSYKILKMDEKTFKQLVVMGSTLFVPFMRLSAADRRTIIDNLLNLDIFSNMLIVAKQNFSILEKEKSSLEKKLEKLTIYLHAEKKENNSIREVLEKNIKELTEEIETIKNAKIPEEKEKADKIVEYIKSINIEELKKSKKDLQKSLKDIELKKNNIKESIKSSNKMIDFFSENSYCPTCTQNISDEISNEKIRTYEAKIQELSISLEEIEENIIEQQKKEKSIDNIVIEIKNAHKIYSEAMNNINHFNKEIEKNQLKIESTKKEIEKIKNTNKEIIEKIEKEILNTKEKIKVIEDKKLDYDTIFSLLKDDGIKSLIIKNYLPVINSIIKKYINMMEFNISFTFDENFNETIKSRNRDILEYNNFSEGEQQRINFALLFTFRDLTRMKSSISTNILIIDEVGDSLLDYEGISSMNNIFKNDNSEIVIITHYPEHYTDVATKKINFEKNGHFTSCKEEKLKI